MTSKEGSLEETIEILEQLHKGGLVEKRVIGSKIEWRITEKGRNAKRSDLVELIESKGKRE